MFYKVVSDMLCSPIIIGSLVIVQLPLGKMILRTFDMRYAPRMVYEYPSFVIHEKSIIHQFLFRNYI